MNDVSPLILVMVGLFLAALILSIRPMFMKLPFFDRFSPLALQIIIAVTIVLPVMHGSPSEWWNVVILVFVWSLFTFVSAYRLYRSPIRLLKALAFLQFIEIISHLLLALFHYAEACYAWHGHLLWNP